jgi:hypothetical protein
MLGEQLLEVGLPCGTHLTWSIYSAYSTSLNARSVLRMNGISTPLAGRARLWLPGAHAKQLWTAAR